MSPFLFHKNWPLLKIGENWTISEYFPHKVYPANLMFFFNMTNGVFLTRGCLLFPTCAKLTRSWSSAVTRLAEYHTAIIPLYTWVSQYDQWLSFGRHRSHCINLVFTNTHITVFTVCHKAVRTVDRTVCEVHHTLRGRRCGGSICRHRWCCTRNSCALAILTSV